MGAVVSDSLETRLSLVGLSQWTSGMGAAARATGLLTDRLDAAAQRSLSFGVASVALAGGLGAFEVRAARAAGELERLTTAFGGVQEGSGAALSEVNDLRNSLAARRFGEDTVLRAALNLRRMGADAGLARDTVSSMAESIAAGAGSSEDLTHVTDVLSLAIQRHSFTQRELRTLVRAGIPVFAILQKTMGLTANQLEDVDLKGAAADEALRSLVSGAATQFNGSIARDLQGLSGSMDDLAHASTMAKEELGKAFAPLVSGAVQKATGMLRGFTQLPDGEKAAISYGLLAATLGLAVNGFVRLRSLAGTVRENITLQNEHLKASVAADKQGKSEDGAAGAMERAGGAAGTLASRLERVAAAHDRAASAALQQAESAAGSSLAAEGAPVAAAAAARKRGAKGKAVAAFSLGEAINAETAPSGADAELDRAIEATVAAQAAGGSRAAATLAADLRQAESGVDASVDDLFRRPAARGLRLAPERAPVGRRALSLSPAALDAERIAAAESGIFARLRRNRPADLRDFLGPQGVPFAPAAAGAETGSLSRAGQFARSPAGIAALTIGGELALSALPNDGRTGRFKGTAQAALGAAGTGAFLGSFAGPEGTAVGALVGALIGGITGYAESREAQRQAGEAPDSVIDELKKQNALLQQQLQELQGLRRAQAFDTKDIPGAQQVAVARLGRAIA